jgi:hypothetical protein
LTALNVPTPPVPAQCPDERPDVHSAHADRVHGFHRLDLLIGT